MLHPCAVAAWFENGVWPDVAWPAQCAGAAVAAADAAADRVADADTLLDVAAEAVAWSRACAQVASQSSAARGAADTISASTTIASVRPHEDVADREAAADREVADREIDRPRGHQSVITRPGYRTAPPRASNPDRLRLRRIPYGGIMST
jgi:hypothetical protein